MHAECCVGFTDKVAKFNPHLFVMRIGNLKLRIPPPANPARVSADGWRYVKLFGTNVRCWCS
jgi:hypothetical protein